MNIIYNFYSWLLDIINSMNLFFYDIIYGINGNTDEQIVVILIFILYFVFSIFILVLFNTVWKIFSRVFFAVVSLFDHI